MLNLKVFAKEQPLLWWIINRAGLSFIHFKDKSRKYELEIYNLNIILKSKNPIIGSTWHFPQWDIGCSENIPYSHNDNWSTYFCQIWVRGPGDKQYLNVSCQQET